MENQIQLQSQLHNFCIINYNFNYNYVIGPSSEQRKVVHTSNSFAFVVFINEMPFIKRCGYGTERLGWSNVVRAEIPRKSP